MIDGNRVPLFSVIIPVYNSGKYIEKLLESIVDQSFKSLEVVLVNDGSTDNSYDICCEYSSKFDYIKILSQENKGPGAARNLGLIASSGKWLSFVDADDYLDLDYYKKISVLIGRNAQLEFVATGVSIFFEDETLYDENEVRWYSKKIGSGIVEIDENIKKNINVELWNKVFRRDVFDKYGIEFTDGVFEDAGVLFRYLSVIKYAYFLNEKLYFYRRSKNTMVTSFHGNKKNKICDYPKDAISVCEMLYGFFVKQNILDSNLSSLLYIFERNCRWILGTIPPVNAKSFLYLASDFMRHIGNNDIEQYGSDIQWLYNIKRINVYRPFYCEHVKNIDLRILTCYHKPSLLPDNRQIFIPIHVGRSSTAALTKDGACDNEEIRWLYENMIGDDTGNNISDKNRKYCELTAVYWAWKNYDKIESPEYIGLAHYRRVFNFYDMSIDEGTDAVVCVPWKSQLNAYDQYGDAHNIKEFDAAIKILKNKYPDYSHVVDCYLTSHELSLLNMFIMKKELFFRYAEWLFPLLEEIDLAIDYGYKNAYDLRAIGFIAERLQNIFMLKLKEEGKVIKYFPLLFPHEKELKIKNNYKRKYNDSSVVVTSCDDNYALYAGVMLESLKCNVKDDKKVEVFVLDNGISCLHREKIKSIESETFKVNFVDMEAYWNTVDADLFKVYSHFTIATYARIFIPEIFKQEEKVVYLDPDMVVCDDFSPLFEIKFDEELLAACIDNEAVRLYYQDVEHRDYIENKLKLKTGATYFQAGVLILNIKEMQEYDFTNKCLTALKEVSSPKWVDQCVLNKVCEGRVKFLNSRWNFPWFVFQNDRYVLNNFDHRVAKKVLEESGNPGIVHYCGGPKPWKEIDNKFSEIFWKYSRLTPFYEEILFNSLRNSSENRHNVEAMPVVKPVLISSNKGICLLKAKAMYYHYKILVQLTFGNVRKRYKRKRKEMKNYIKFLGYDA